MTLYSAHQMQAEVERVMKVVREDTLRKERERVTNAALLFTNTLAGEREAQAVSELIGFLYEQSQRMEG